MILVAALAAAAALGLTEATTPAASSAGPTSTVRRGFVPVTDPETGVTISIPSNWVRYSDHRDPTVRLEAGNNYHGDLLTVRVNAYSTEITEANLADQKAVFDGYLATEEIQVLDQKTTKLANLPALFYVYRFQDKATGKTVFNVQYNVFQGRKMVQLVLRGLPEDDYRQLSSTFDEIANSLKVEPGAPPAFLEESARFRKPCDLSGHRCPDRPLEGTRWRVTGTFDPQVGSSIAAPQGELILSGGQVRFTGPCNDLQGAAAVTGGTITFGPLTAGPSRPCGQDQQRSQASVGKVLAGPVRATVSSDALRLEHQDGTGVNLAEAP